VLGGWTGYRPPINSTRRGTQRLTATPQRTTARKKHLRPVTQEKEENTPAAMEPGGGAISTRKSTNMKSRSSLHKLARASEVTEGKKCSHPPKWGREKAGREKKYFENETRPLFSATAGTELTKGASCW